MLNKYTELFDLDNSVAQHLYTAQNNPMPTKERNDFKTSDYASYLDKHNHKRKHFFTCVGEESAEVLLPPRRLLRGLGFMPFRSDIKTGSARLTHHVLLSRDLMVTCPLFIHYYQCRCYGNILC